MYGNFQGLRDTGNESSRDYIRLFLKKEGS